MPRAASTARASARPRGPPNDVVDDIPAHAVRRSDHVGGSQVGQGLAERGLQPGVRVRQLKAGRASLPHAHQPHRVDAVRRDLVPGRGGHVGQRYRPPGGARLLTQPDRGVHLVDHRRPRPSSHGAPRPAGPAAAEAGSPAPPGNGAHILIQLLTVLDDHVIHHSLAAATSSGPIRGSRTAGRLPEWRRQTRRASPGRDESGRFYGVTGDGAGHQDPMASGAELSRT